jgi:hypothetical protein
MPEWLARKLENDGVIDFSHAGPPATRRTRAILCPGCRRPIMRGLMPLPTPWPVDADPTPLSSLGEALALLAGVKTYELSWSFDHYEIRHREWSMVTYGPADTLKESDVLGAHNCRVPTSPAWPTKPSLVPDPNVVEAPLPDEPPF